VSYSTKDECGTERSDRLVKIGQTSKPALLNFWAETLFERKTVVSTTDGSNKGSTRCIYSVIIDLAVARTSLAAMVVTLIIEGPNL